MVTQDPIREQIIGCRRETHVFLILTSPGITMFKRENLKYMSRTSDTGSRHNNLHPIVKCPSHPYVSQNSWKSLYIQNLLHCWVTSDAHAFAESRV